MPMRPFSRISSRCTVELISISASATVASSLIGQFLSSFMLLDDSPAGSTLMTSSSRRPLGKTSAQGDLYLLMPMQSLLHLHQFEIRNSGALPGGIGRSQFSVDDSWVALPSSGCPSALFAKILVSPPRTALPKTLAKAQQSFCPRTPAV